LLPRLHRAGPGDDDELVCADGDLVDLDPARRGMVFARNERVRRCDGTHLLDTGKLGK